MIELIQFPWSPFCIVQRRILEFAETPFKIINIPNGERSLVWKLTKERYYQVPIIRDGRNVIFELDNDSQVVAKYCTLIDQTNPKRTALTKVDATGKKLIPILDVREGVWGIRPRNREQHFAFDALLDD